MRNLFVTVCLVLIGCGGTTSSGPTDSIEDRNVERPPNPAAGPHGGEPSPPTPDCDACSGDQVCTSAEEASWNHCGAPRQRHCRPDEVGDSCGHCFARCDEDYRCAEGFFCNGRYCTGPRECRPPPERRQ